MEREDGVGLVVRVIVRAGEVAAARAHVPDRVDGVVVKMVEAD